MSLEKERLKYRGRLAEKRLQEQNLVLKITGLRDAIRDKLDPFTPLLDLQCDIVAAEAVQLAELQVQFRQVAKEIHAITRALGE
jgi:hypothetical protein